MLYWYQDLMIDEKLAKKKDAHIARIEKYYYASEKSKIFSNRKRWWEAFVSKTIPWKEYFVIARATNPENLFDVMSTRQWVFRHYAKSDIFVIGLYSSQDDAIEAVQEVLTRGFSTDASYDPKNQFLDDGLYNSTGNSTSA